MEVSGVYNYCNEVSWLAATRSDLKRKRLYPRLRERRIKIVACGGMSSGFMTRV
jgi:hypothetical protein